MARAMSVDVLECRPAGLADLPQRLAAIGSVPEETGLVYVSDSEPGIRRQRRGKGFAYRMLKTVYRVEARVEACSRGRPVIIVDDSIALG